MLDPTILFFFLGLLAVFVRSDLDVPQPIPKLLSLYLLIAIGFKGGYELRHGGMNSEVAVTLVLAIAMATAVPLYTYYFLRRKLDASNSAAIAAAYGSVSAVTFATATSYLQRLNVPSGGHMVAAMALMESPAILIGIFLAGRAGKGRRIVWSKVFREAVTNGSVWLLMGSLIIGWITGESGWASLKPFFGDVYKGMLVLFLLDMGLVAAKRLGDIKRAGAFLFRFAILTPVFNAVCGIGLAYLAGLQKGNAFLFTILCGSASYIAVPAAMRLAVPEANPSLYVSMSLALTFPFNIMIGLPAYYWLIDWIWP